VEERVARCHARGDGMVNTVDSGMAHPSGSAKATSASRSGNRIDCRAASLGATSFIGPIGVGQSNGYQEFSRYSALLFIRRLPVVNNKFADVTRLRPDNCCNEA
jgi:hypothetical protein